jgi:hypothetical protein
VRIYAENWGRPGDLGVVGEIDGEPAPIGACWMRVMPPGVGLGWVDAGDAAARHRPLLALSRPGPRPAPDAGGARRGRAAGRAQVALTVHPQNPAIALYESCGFEKVALRNTYHLMVARLAPATP